jgi:hypothetical protein
MMHLKALVGAIAEFARAGVFMHLDHQVRVLYYGHITPQVLVYPAFCR